MGITKELALLLEEKKIKVKKEKLVIFSTDYFWPEFGENTWYVAYVKNKKLNIKNKTYGLAHMKMKIEELHYLKQDEGVWAELYEYGKREFELPKESSEDVGYANIDFVNHFLSNKRLILELDEKLVKVLIKHYKEQ